MLRILVLVIAIFPLDAGTIQGVVIEHASGRAVSRTVIRLDAVPQADGVARVPISVRAGRSGQFLFPSIAPGIYILSANRQGYFPAAYGQRLPIGHGTPIEVTADSSLFAELRMRHKGAITGRVLDENGIGTTGVPVVAYRAKLPLRPVASGTSDDRGVYRIHGLNPGKYWIRSGGHTLEDGTGWSPTYGPQGRELRDARIHRVSVDADTAYADVTPEPGTLFHLGGSVTCDNMFEPASLSISSETGRRSMSVTCGEKYGFEGLAMGNYEVFATLKDGRLAGFVELTLGRNDDSVNILLLQPPTMEFEIRRAGSNAVTNINYKLIGRRQDLAETEIVQEIKTPRTALAPGHWEFRAQVPSGQYVESIAQPFATSRRPAKTERSPDWYEVIVESRGASRIRVVVSDRASQISGKVMTDGKPIVGAPVFLAPVGDAARRSLGSPYLVVLADTTGQFRFESLPPGDYRILCSFDVDELDEDLLELSKAVVVHVEAGQTAAVDLPVWIAP